MLYHSIHNAAFTGLTVEEKTGIGLNSKVVNLQDFALIRFSLSRRRRPLLRRWCRRATRIWTYSLSILFKSPLTCGSDSWDPTGAAGTPQPATLPLTFGQSGNPHQLYDSATFGKWCFRISWNAGEAPGTTYFSVAICLYSERSKVRRRTTCLGDRARGPKLVHGHHADGTAKSSNAMLREHRREWHYLLRAGSSHDHQAHFQHISSADRHSNGALSLKARRRSARPTPTPARNKSN